MIELQNVTKDFGEGEGQIHAVHDISLTIEDGEIFGIIGLSGAGKSTLVRCINLLERPTSGSVIVDGKDLFKLDEKALVMSSDVIEAVKRLDRAGNPFDFIFMDPPYRMDLPKKVLEALKDTCLADEETLIIVEEALEADFSWVCALGYEIVKSKEYKTNKHVFLRKKEN